MSPCSNTKDMKRTIIILILAILAVTAYAQHDEQVTVEGKYRPKVNKVSKLQLNPETPQPSYDLPSTEVNPMEAKQKFSLDLEKIAPTGYAAKNDKLVEPTKNFLMAGIGTRLSPIFLYKHNSMLTKTLGLGVGVKHNSSWVKMKDYAPSGYMNNAFDINLSTSRFDGLQLDGGVYFKNDMYHFYGMNLAEIHETLTPEQIAAACPRQTYNTIGGHLGLASTTTRVGEFSHDGHLDYLYMFNREHAIDLGYTLGYADNWWGDKSHPQKVGVKLDFQYDYCMGQEPHFFNVSRVLFAVNPFFEMSGGFYRLHLGVRLDGTTKYTEDDHFLAVRPDVRASLFILNNKLEFYAGLNGGRKLMRFSDLVADNPFISPDINPSLCTPNVKLGFDGGIRTNIVDIVDVHLGVRYRLTDNDPLYMRCPVNMIFPVPEGFEIPIWNSYDLVCDQTQLVTVMADVRVKLRNSLTADLGFAYNNCKPASEEYAWYRPTTEGKLKLTYGLNDKLSFNTTFLYQGGRYAKVPELGDYGLTYTTQKLKDVFDLSIGADYKVNDQITAFALLDNVAHQKYHLYYDYPVTGIQFFAGVKLRF